MLYKSVILSFLFIAVINIGCANANLNDDFKTFLERLKLWMPYLDCISKDLPVLEPIYIDKQEFNLEHEIGKFTGAFMKLNIKNLSTFETKLFNLVLLSRKFEVNITIPELVIDGKYIIDGNIGDLIPLTGKGDMEITLEDVDVAVQGQLQIEPLGIAQLNVYFNISNFNGYFHGLMGDPELEEVFNKLLNDIAKEALDVLWPEIEVEIVKLLKQKAKEMLADFTLMDLLNIVNKIKDLLPEKVSDDCKSKPIFHAYSN